MKTPRTPAWVWAICLGIGLVEPATHLYLKLGLPEGVAFSGLHIGDTPFFLHAMRMFGNGFFSAYVTCQYEAGSYGATLFPLIHHWLYGAVGALGMLLRADPFLFLGAANGLGAGFYAWTVHRFMAVAAEGQARLAFLLFALAGGLGGILFLATGALGLHQAAGFDIAFHRWARYELIEGPFLSPFLIAPRLYYTLPLALGFLALGRYLKKGLALRAGDHLPALLALFAAASINARLGPMFWLAVACHLGAQQGTPIKRRALLGALYGLPVAAGVGVTLLGLRMNPDLAAGISGVLSRSIWFGSLLSLVFWHLFAGAPAARSAWTGMPHLLRVVSGACLGYLGAFALLYAGYQTYWGNWLGRGDASAAIHISDAALPGAVLGAFLGWRRRPQGAPPASLSWTLPWLLILCAVGVSALGGGYLLRFMPERLLVMMPAPLALLSAAGLQHWMRKRRWVGGTLLAAMLFCGVSSTAVACLAFQGPLGFTPGQGPFTLFHTELITPNEDAMLDRIEGGVVLAPAAIPLFGDLAITRHPGTRTVHGQGTLGFGDVPIAEMGAKVTTFFGPATSEAYRRDFVEVWCVDYIICPEIPPVDPATVSALEAAPWTEVVHRAGGAVLLKVSLDD